MGILNSVYAYKFNDEIYMVDPEVKDLKSFRLILNYDYFQFLNNNTPYRLYQKIWGLNSREYEMGINDSTIIISEKLKFALLDSKFKKYDYDVMIPIIMKLEDYKKNRIASDNLKLLYQIVYNKFNPEQKIDQIGGGIYLLNKKVGDTQVSINLKGNISIKCDLCFSDSETSGGPDPDNNKWDLKVEQTQRFTLESVIGEKLYIKAEQNSQADFDWQNSLLIEYRGDENEIVQNVSAGNISLSLPGTKIVSVGMGKRTGLFGIKMINKFGALNIQTIIGREKVSKNSQTIVGGESSGGFQINDYNFIKDRYFFIDKEFKRRFYPLSNNGSSVVDPCYQISEFELFKKITNLSGDNNTGIYVGRAYIDANDSTSKDEFGLWKKLVKGEDYELDTGLNMKKRGFIRLNTVSNDVVAAHYTIAECEENPDLNYDTGTNIDFVNNQSTYDYCLNTAGCESGDDSLVEGIDYEEVDGNPGYFGGQIILKFIKDKSGSSDPSSSETWPLMFKNIYSLGASNIDLSSLEVEIIHVKGPLGTETMSENGKTFLNIFGLDNVDNETLQIKDSGDGKIDINGNLINAQYGELFLPFYMPFAYDDSPFGEVAYSDGNYNQYWGNSHSDLSDVFNAPLSIAEGIIWDSPSPDPGILIYNDGPAMYYSSNTNDYPGEHEFVININHSSQSATINLGFMIAENSETVMLNGSTILTKGIDYNIDYFSGTINLISDRALDPAAEIRISYDQNELISFDQKIMMGSYLSYDIDPENRIFGGLYYYTQSLKDQKVEIGYEPMRNFIWHIGGNFFKEYSNINKFINNNTHLDLEQTSKLSLNFEYAEVDPNPNPLGRAYIDDFESSKRSNYVSILYSSWKKSSSPIYYNDLDSSISKFDLKQRIDMSWYSRNIPTTDIWPNIETSTTLNNKDTKILSLDLNQYSSNYLENSSGIFWNGVTIPLIDSDHNQSNNKYLDIWINPADVNQEITFNIDIGHISEDINDNGELNSEDKKTFGGTFGNGLLEFYEDIGLDGCLDQYEDGWGGCLCNNFDDENQYCIDENSQDLTYAYYVANYPDQININTTSEDPNRDNFNYDDDNYTFINGTQGNGSHSGFTYPDTEDLNGNLSIDAIDSRYYTYSFDLTEIDHPMMISESGTDNNNDGKGDWKLYRIPLKEFLPIKESDSYTLSWEDVRHIRLWIYGENIMDNQNIDIAKVEIVGNEWDQLGMISNEALGDLQNNGTYLDTTVYNNDNITIQVVNTEENSNYIPPEGVLGEYDAYGGVYTKEQSLSIDFMNLSSDSEQGGLKSDSTVFIKKNFDYSSLSGDKSNSFFIYRNLEMEVQPIRDISSSSGWVSDDGNVDLCFRFGSEEKYYELRRSLVPKNTESDDWISFNINLDSLSLYKNYRFELESYHDWGIDQCENSYENGINCLPDTLIQNNITATSICNAYIDSTESDFFTIDYDNEELSVDNLFIPFDFVMCPEYDNDISWEGSLDDPNGDNCDENGNPIGCSENNLNYDDGELVDVDIDNNGIYDPPFFDYDLDNEIYFWEDEDEYCPNGEDTCNDEDLITVDLDDICQDCNRLSIKGEPALDRIDYIMVGIINQTEETIFGRVYLNELRMTGVKKNKGKSFIVDGSFNLGEFITLSGNYSQQDSDYHMLEERISKGSHKINYGFNINAHPEELFKKEFFKMPISLNYSKTLSSPKFQPGSDIILGAVSEVDEKYLTKKDLIIFSIGLDPKLSNIKDNLFNELVDNLSLDYTYKYDVQSSPTILNKENYNQVLKYNYVSSKNDIEIESYTFYPFKNLLNDKENSFLEKIKNFKINFRPKKIISTGTYTQVDGITINRNSPDNPIEDNTRTYSKTFKLENYEIINNLNTNYSIVMSSNINADYNPTISNIIDPWSSVGNLKTWGETFSFSYRPEFADWLSPTFSYIPKYSWAKNLSSDIDNPAASISSNNDFSMNFAFSLQKFIEIFYSSSTSSSSSSSYKSKFSKNKSSSKNKDKKLEIKNRHIKSILKYFHTVSSRFSNINITAKYKTNLKYTNIDADFSPDYHFRLGLHSEPKKLEESLEEFQIGNLVNSNEQYFYNEYKFSTTLQLTKNLSLSGMEYKYTRTKNLFSDSETVTTISNSFFPLGANGRDGLPIFNYSINLSRLEQYWGLDKWFKSIVLSHSYSGQESKTYEEVNGVTLLQKVDFTKNFSPLISLTGKFQKIPDLSMTVRYNDLLTIYNTGTQTERKSKNEITFSTTYKKRNGLTINLPGLKNFELDNDMTFKFDLSYSEDETLLSYILTNDLDDFQRTASSKNITIKPSMTYSFSKFVDGNVYVSHIITESLSSRKTEDTCFGFSVSILFESLN